MSQFICYDPQSSEVIARAASLKKLITKVVKENGDWLSQRLSDKCPDIHFSVKEDPHADDDEAEEIEISVVQAEFKSLSMGDNFESLRALILAMYADDAQYPQLKLPEMQKDRLEKMMKLI